MVKFLEDFLTIKLLFHLEEFFKLILHWRFLYAIIEFYQCVRIPAYLCHLPFPFV